MPQTVPVSPFARRGVPRPAGLPGVGASRRPAREARRRPRHRADAISRWRQRASVKRARGSARDGVIAFARAPATSDLVWVDRDGRTLETASSARQHADFRLSPDGRLLAASEVEASSGQSDLYVLDFSRGTVPLYLRMFPARFPTLAFIGLFQPVGCIWPAAELQAKVLARRWSGAWSPPPDLEGAIRDEIAHPDYPQLDTPRHTITVDYHRFKQRLLRQLPHDWQSTTPVLEVTRSTS